jgi:hypothetical protein
MNDRRNYWNWTASDVGQLSKRIDSAFEVFDTNYLVYRGVSKRHSLLPKGRRRELCVEADLYYNFLRFAPSRTHGSLPKEPSEWLCLMQHYGLPTRLLDWTESPLVAAHFALAGSNNDVEDAVIWTLDPIKLNQIMLGVPDLFPLHHHFEEPHKYFDSEVEDSPTPDERPIVAVAPTELDIRVAVQQAQFTIHHSKEPLENHPRAREFLGCVRIPKAKRESMRDELRTLGIRKRNLFPDLEHLAEDLQLDFPDVGI